MVTWSDLESAAPEIGRAGRERLSRDGVALLGTLCADGSPRISPVSLHFAAGQLLFGAMAQSMKVRDLGRDPRCVLHNPISDPDGGDGEFKLRGRAWEVVDQEVRDADSEAWWVSRPTEQSRVFWLDVELAAFISYDTESDEMVISRWSPEGGVSESRGTYP